MTDMCALLVRRRVNGRLLPAGRAGRVERAEPAELAGPVVRDARGRRDRGQAALETLGFVPFLLLIALAAIQLGMAAYCAQQASTAARAAARSEATEAGYGDVAGHAAVSGWVSARLTISGCGGGGDAVSCTASVSVPSIIPGLSFGPATRTATMPNDNGTP
ncbi:TadE/TadG family type IV pilus assembly protein [Streptomyces sp. NPDC093225]|uniref:TadE/TadG family type IV pilus assembly protein n=1 Tax=Streptomyces sp. NPDC093225 TaxID=3366034 RepID=UPI0038260E81